MIKIVVEHFGVVDLAGTCGLQDGFDHLVGSIEPGKQADLACVDLSALETQPLHNVVSQLIYATGRHQVSDVWIAGKQKLRQRVLVDIDLDGVLANARQWRERIASVRNA